MDVLAGIFAAALLQDLSYTSKTVLVSRGHRTLAVAADISAMLTSSLYLILTASVTLRSGLSFATLEAFAAIAVGGACGTIGGMFAVEWVERHLTLNTPISSRPGNRRQDYRRWVSTWLSCRQTPATTEYEWGTTSLLPSSIARAPSTWPLVRPEMDMTTFPERDRFRDSGWRRLPGGTDARNFAPLGIRTYGFLPHNFPDGVPYERAMHDADERVPVSALEVGTAAIHQAIERYRG